MRFHHDSLCVHILALTHAEKHRNLYQWQQYCSLTDIKQELAHGGVSLKSDWKQQEGQLLSHLSTSTEYFSPFLFKIVFLHSIDTLLGTPFKYLLYQYYCARYDMVQP